MSLSYPPSAVIFDCDGVLVDTEPLHYKAYQEVLQPFGLGYDYEAYLNLYIGFDDRDAFLAVFEQAKRPLEPPALEGLIDAKSKALQAIASRGIPSFPGVVALVQDLVDHGVPLAVASGALRSEVEMFVSVLGLSQAFRIIVGADDVSRSKPDPETYILALERLRENMGLPRLDPRSCIAIEDTPAGIRSAKGADLFVIAVANSYPVDHLNQADHVVESLAELKAADLEKLIRPKDRG